MPLLHDVKTLHQQRQQ